MPDFLVISTGGTIASRSGAEGLAPSLPGEELLTFVPDIDQFGNITILDLFSKDSSNMSPDDWKMMAACLRAEEKTMTVFSSSTGPIQWPIQLPPFHSFFRDFQSLQ